MINSCGFLYNVVTKFQLILLLSDEFNERTDEITISISSPNSCSNLFSSLTYKFEELIILSCFWQGNIWQGGFYISAHVRKFWTDPVAIFSLLRLFSWSPSNKKIINTFKGLCIKTNIGKKVSLRSSDLWELGNC